MDIHEQLNEGGCAEWEFEESDVDEEENSVNETANADGEEATGAETDTASVAAAVLPAAQRKLTGNAYVDGIICESGLYIIRSGEISLAYKERGELGLLSLFFTREFCDSCRAGSTLCSKRRPSRRLRCLKLTPISA
ncbi:hypothetical protein V7S43_000335 [Phytophthora oleae]|uniref:Cyclic nucleotide-binding domain-containing protein n=1 Tax=Phytophthora oleae TaxID=2107226 RepID=A0ABD3G9A5_9STRA